jgi:predicted short-subunit dehydrogenase-like oxidoreductase (DUF2520 family)
LGNDEVYSNTGALSVGRASYLIIGNGRLAKHFSFYFNQLGLKVQQWSRSDSSAALSRSLVSSSHVLLLISDYAIEAFIQQHPVLATKIVLHCSGSLQTDLAYGVHPLMTFSQALYDLATYQQISLVFDSQQDPQYLLPGLANPSYYLPKQAKAYYHALCVMANNFSTLLWQKFFSELEQRYAIPKEAGQLFLQQTLNNISQDPGKALTGPLVRNDHITLSHDLAALAGDEFAPVFTAMCEAYRCQQEKQYECA